MFFPQNVNFPGCTLPETKSSPLKIGHPKRKLVLQPSIFRFKMAKYSQGVCFFRYLFQIALARKNSDGLVPVSTT